MARMASVPPFPEMLLCGETANCRAELGAGHATETYLHPRFMAEEVCSEALVRMIRLRRSKSQMHAAWGALEFGLTMKERPDDAEAFFNYAEETFWDIRHTSDKALTIINAQLGTTFMPAYRARYDQDPLSRRGLTLVQGEIAHMLDTFDATYDPNGLDKYAGVKPELVTLALFARLHSFEWLAYPASPREENTDISDFNHDCYVLRNGIKVPVQVKRKNGSGYDDTVAVVRLSKIMERVNAERLRRTTQSWGNKRKATRPLRLLDAIDFSQLIVREAKGEWLGTHEKWLLEVASMAAVQQVMEKEAIIRGEYVARSGGRIALAA